MCIIISLLCVCVCVCDYSGCKTNSCTRVGTENPPAVPTSSTSLQYLKNFAYNGKVVTDRHVRIHLSSIDCCTKRRQLYISPSHISREGEDGCYGDNISIYLSKYEGSITVEGAAGVNEVGACLPRVSGYRVLRIGVANCMPPRPLCP